MSWASGNENYTGAETMEVTVPVMYSPSDDVYVLGDYSNKVMVSNCYDMVTLSRINMVITDDPSDIDSWHFVYDSDSTTGAEYFCDPNYIIMSYSGLLDTIEIYTEQYGAEFSSRPVMLTVYYRTTGEEYPSDLSEFIANAAYFGNMLDWATFMTSPADIECFRTDTLAHEYLHLIQEQMCSFNYENESGAIAESFADVIGFEMSYYTVRVQARCGAFMRAQILSAIWKILMQPKTRNIYTAYIIFIRQTRFLIRHQIMAVYI